jgi:glycosyltransferase involved in cell wall biosynthesis
MKSRPRVDVLLAVGYDPDVRVRRVTQSLAGDGYDVRILAWDRDGTRPRTEMDGQVRIERVRIRSAWGRGWTQVFFLVPLLVRYLRLVRARRPDVIHAVDLPMLAGAMAMGRLSGRPRIVYDAFEIYEVMVSHRMPRLLLRLTGWLERLLPRRAALVIAPGEGRRRYFAERGISAVSVPNWTDPPVTEPDREAARAALGIGADRFCILYQGALQPSRDLDALLTHARRHPEDLVLIAGRGDDEARLRRAAAGSENVRFLGWVADPGPLLAAADVMYYSLRPDHPYAALAAPNNLYVAIAHAVPLVYRPQGELAIVGAEHQIGATFTDGDDLERAFARLRDPVANEAVRAGLRELRERYRWARAAAVLLAAYPRNGSASSKPMP